MVITTTWTSNGTPFTLVTTQGLAYDGVTLIPGETRAQCFARDGAMLYDMQCTYPPDP